MVVSRAVLDADYIINLPRFKTHSFMMATGAIKNTYGYIAGACKAKLHLQASNRKHFASAVCDIYQLRPPDLNIMDAVTVIQGNGPCHGGQLRKVGKLLAGKDALAVDSVMAQMMGVDPDDLPVQREAGIRGLGTMKTGEMEVSGPVEQIPDFQMPVTFSNQRLDDETIKKLQKLYPPGMMLSRTKIFPLQKEEKCALCGECVESCPAEALTIDPEFRISDKCIACYCCVELCPEGALEVPDVEAYRHY
jgi:ferredoxin